MSEPQDNECTTLPPLSLAIFGGRGSGTLAAFTFARACAPGRGSVVGFLNDTDAIGTLLHGHTVIGPFGDWPSLGSTVRFLAPLHKQRLMAARLARISSLGVPVERWANVVDPNAVVADGSLAGRGIWVQSGASVMPTARIGSHVAIRSNAHVSHDVVVGTFASIGIGAIVCGYSTVGEGAYLAPAAVIRDGVTIGRFAVVGLGAVVVCDVPEYAVTIGNPARVVGATGEGP